MARYATLGLLKLTPGMRALAEGVADQGVASIEQLPGFVSVTFFLDEARNEYGAFTIWESREAADNANAALTPPFEQAFGEHLQGRIETVVYEIYEPKRA